MANQEMLFKDLVEQTVVGSFGNSLLEERSVEKKQIGKAWDFYYGYQEQYIRQYRGETEDDFKDKDKPTFNYTRAIIDEYVRGVFGKPVIVGFAEDNGAGKKHQEVWDKIVEPLAFFDAIPFLKQVQRIAEISNTCFVMVRHNAATGTTYFEDIRGEFVTFLPDPENPKDIGTVIINYLYDTGDLNPERRLMRRIEIWDRKNWAIWLYSPTMKEYKLVEQGSNPYGFIPGVRFQPQQDDNTFYGISTVNDIVTINEVYNNLWTALVRISIFQSFSILVVTTDGTLDVIVAPTRFIKFEKSREGTRSSDAKYISPEAKINEVEKVLMSLKNELQNFAHVPGEVMSSAGTSQAPQSGYALRIKRMPIENLWDERRMSYGPSYRRLIKTAVVIDELNGGEIQSREEAAAKLEEVNPEITFTDTKPGLAPEEMVIKDQHDLQYGVISPVDIVLRDHPEMSRDEAKQLIIDNRKETQEVGVTVMEDKKDAEEGFDRLNRRMAAADDRQAAEA
jgi:hypothetical protein